MPALKRGAEVDVTIESLAFGGDGVGRVDGMVIFVPEALPGQQVRVRVQRKKSGFARGRLLEVLQPSPDEVPPRCRHFTDCGGCTLQHLAYPKQLEAKAAQVRELLARLGGFADAPLQPIVAAPAPFHYRNKMEYTFGRRRWLTRAEIAQADETFARDFALGLHVRGRFDKILHIEQCHLQHPRCDAIRNFIAARAAQSELRPYTTVDHSGFWRFLVLREGSHTGELLVNFVTADGGPGGEAAVQTLAHALAGQFPEVKTIIHTINRSKAQVATGDEQRVLHGPGRIFDKIGPHTFRISPASFFQTNTRGAELLYARIAALADLQGGETLYDLYCGAGTIGIYLSARVRRVVGIELVEQAVADARENARANGVENCSFVCSDVKALLESGSAFFERHGRPDAIVFDPPRAGLHPGVVEQAIALAPPKIIYVSCNPATFARDAKLLCARDYRLAAVQPVDLFPHTGHIELIGLLLHEARNGFAPGSENDPG